MERLPANHRASASRERAGVHDRGNPPSPSDSPCSRSSSHPHSAPRPVSPHPCTTPPAQRSSHCIASASDPTRSSVTTLASPRTSSSARHQRPPSLTAATNFKATDKMQRNRSYALWRGDSYNGMLGLMKSSGDENLQEVTPGQEQKQERASGKTDSGDTDLDLLINSWSRLPGPLRAGIAAMVKAAMTNEQ